MRASLSFSDHCALRLGARLAARRQHQAGGAEAGAGSLEEPAAIERSGRSVLCAHDRSVHSHVLMILAYQSTAAAASEIRRRHGSAWRGVNGAKLRRNWSPGDETSHCLSRRDDQPGGRRVSQDAPHRDRANRRDRAARPARTAADRRAHSAGSGAAGRAQDSAPSSRRRSTMRCRIRTSGSPGSSTSASRRSWRSSRICARRSPRRASSASSF